ncbi:MAG: hypothetical protein LBS54_03655 [Dysgonamonadaceae bacterium]|jgi:hypothetical protein|nr:hypothetical protein [Dysgonamonadaceae bacterium]
MKFVILIPAIFICLVACDGDRQRATQMLRRASAYYYDAQLDPAQAVLDSIKSMYPKDGTVLKDALQLSRKIDIRNNERIVFLCDSLLPLREAEFETLKKGFVYEKDPEYDEEGKYFAKTHSIENHTGRSYIRSWVSEAGKFFLASVYYGSRPINHKGLKVSIAGGGFAETSLIPADGGLNYTFRDLGMTTQVVTYVDGKDNGVSMFIYDNRDKRISAEYIGGEKYSITVTASDKAALVKTIDFASTIAEIVKIRKEKEKATGRIEYLKTKVSDL